jgi:chromosomal replication initiator protein
MSVAAFEPTAQEVWSRVVARAREELPAGSFNMWFSRVRADRLADGVLSLEVPTDYVRDWLFRNYLGLIRDEAQEAAGHPVRIDIRSAGLVERPEAGDEAAGWGDDPTTDAHRPVEGHPGSTRERSPLSRPEAGSDALGPVGLPERYTFESFVPGQSNRFAHAAALAVAEAPPSKAYNPLFIYGGVGLGKTHLLYAIGHYMTQLNPGMRCKYVTSETFVTEFIKAVRERQAYQFQRK